ncbi:MAG: response regulator [Thermoguttaceae bacterium]
MVKVLIVDDSEMTRQILSREISKAPDMTVVATADNPFSARDKIVSLRPDVVTLDIEMPRMDGLTFLGKLMRYYPMPVIVVSSYTQKCAGIALEALDLGAVDVLEKPRHGQSVEDFGKTLVRKIRNAAEATRFIAKQKKPQTALPRPNKPILFNQAYKLLVVGASLGGTEAIKKLLLGFPGNSPCILIVQHLPHAFCEPFAKRLDDECELDVHVAQVREALMPGKAIIAPGDKHIVLCKSKNQYYISDKQ